RPLRKATRTPAVVALHVMVGLSGRPGSWLLRTLSWWWTHPRESPARGLSSRLPGAPSPIARGATVALHAWAIICGDKRIDRILERRRVAGEPAGDRVVATDLPVEADRFCRMQGKCAALHLLDPRLDRGREVGWKGEVMPPRTSGGASEMRGIGPPCGFVTGGEAVRR